MHMVHLGSKPEVWELLSDRIAHLGLVGPGWPVLPVCLRKEA